MYVVYSQQRAVCTQINTTKQQLMILAPSENELVVETNQLHQTRPSFTQVQTIKLLDFESSLNQSVTRSRRFPPWLCKAYDARRGARSHEQVKTTEVMIIMHG